MAQIASQNNVVTLINVFTVTPENQQKLADMLVEGRSIRHANGAEAIRSRRVAST